MDRQQELKSLGFFGTLKEFFKLILSNKKIFFQIVVALIIPLSLIFQANILTARLLSSNIFQQSDSLDPKEFGIPKYSNLNFSDFNSFQWAAYWVLIEIAYYTFILILSLLCTCTVSYIIACVYSAEDIDFKKAMAVVPKVWNRVLFTFLLSFAIVFAYDYLLGAVFVLILRLLIDGLAIVGVIIGIVLLILFLAGSIYITVIWHLATVVSVLEEHVFGIKAITKSRKLIKGQIGVAVGVLILFCVFSAGIDAVFDNFVVDGSFVSLGIRTVVGIVCFLLTLLLILFGLVVQTVIYFVCKSHHNENIAQTNAEDYVNAPHRKATELQPHQLPV